MGAGSFASFTQGDLVGAAMGGRGTLGAVKAAEGLIRAEIGVMSSGRSMISGGNPLMPAGGQVGRNFAGTAPKPWDMAANNAVPQVLRNQAAGNAARDAIAAARPGSLIRAKLNRFGIRIVE